MVAMTGRSTQLKYASEGKCERCGKNKPSTATLCTACAAKHNSATAALKERLLKKGLCAWCAGKNKSIYRTCDACRESYNARRRAARLLAERQSTKR